MKKKARSRLNKSQVKPSAEENENRDNSKIDSTNSRIKKNQPESNSILKKYLKHLPTLILSIPFYFATYYIVNNIPPENIKHSFLVNSYSPLQTTLFMGNLFFFSFIFLKTRRGFFISLFIFLMLFFRLQEVVFEWWWVLGVFIGLIIIEIFSIFIKKIISKS